MESKYRLTLNCTNYNLVLIQAHKTSLNKRQRIPKGQSNMDNAEKLATQGTKDKDKQIKKIKNCPIRIKYSIVPVL